MIQLYQNINVLKVLSLFLRDPYNGYYLRELARKLPMDPMTVKRALDLLVGDGLILKYREKNMILYKGSTENPHFTFTKVSYSLSVIYDSHLVEHIMECVFGSICIVLYGSVAKGEDGNDSDLDLLVISSSDQVALSIEDLPWEFNPVFMTLDDWTKTSSSNRPFYDEVIRTGIVLHGTLPVMD